VIVQWGLVVGGDKAQVRPTFVGVVDSAVRIVNLPRGGAAQSSSVRVVPTRAKRYGIVEEATRSIFLPCLGKARIRSNRKGSAGDETAGFKNLKFHFDCPGFVEKAEQSIRPLLSPDIRQGDIQTMKLTEREFEKRKRASNARKCYDRSVTCSAGPAAEPIMAMELMKPARNAATLTRRKCMPSDVSPRLRRFPPRACA